jgi:hypothetical protein
MLAYHLESLKLPSLVQAFAVGVASAHHPFDPFGRGEGDEIRGAWGRGRRREGGREGREGGREGGKR